MRVTITPGDRMVYVDGDARRVHDHVEFPDIHAVQWYHDHGHIEYKNHEIPNKRIDSFKDFERFVDHHKDARARDDELQRKAEEDFRRNVETAEREQASLLERIAVLETKVEALVRKA